MAPSATRDTPAIPTARSDAGEAALYWLLMRPALWQTFATIRVQIVGRLPRPADGPLICYFNHPGWWDLYMAMLVHRKVLQRRFEGYGMMEEPQLRAYRFFTRAGAFSVNRHSPREAARSIAYISRLLAEQPGRALHIFPQGTITPNDQRPLRLYSGTAHIVKRLGEATLCPVVLRYELRGAQHPEAFIRLGPCHQVTPPVDVAALTDEVTQRLTASADALRDTVIADDMRPFRVLLHGKPGIDRLFDYLRQLWSALRP